MRISILFSFTQYTLPTSMCTRNFIILIQVVVEKILTKMSIMCYIGVTEGKSEKGKMSFSIYIFIYTIHLAYLNVYTKFENTGSNRS